MKRYFYTDPLAAAWMAKHFGMRFLRPDGSTVNLSHSSWERKGHDGMISFVAVPEPADSIHPDSLHLLEPQVGDICINDDAEYNPGAPFRDVGNTWEPFHIIQRNGKAFHRPEQEESC
jgi:hypothetical protein